MNVRNLVIAAGLLPVAFGTAQAQNRAYRDAVTHQQLAKPYQAQVDPVTKLPALQVPEEAEMKKLPVPTSLVASSDILQANGLATLVPKRAILYVPENLRSVLTRPEGAELLVWRDFYRANRSWIETVEVSRAHAEGWEPLPAELVENFRKGSRVVVATLQGGPISVMPTSEAIEAPATAEKETE